jgi:hypothetical protein
MQIPLQQAFPFGQCCGFPTESEFALAGEPLQYATAFIL